MFLNVHVHRPCAFDCLIFKNDLTCSNLTTGNITTVHFSKYWDFASNVLVLWEIPAPDYTGTQIPIFFRGQLDKKRPLFIEDFPPPLIIYLIAYFTELRINYITYLIALCTVYSYSFIRFIVHNYTIKCIGTDIQY